MPGDLKQGIDILADLVTGVPVGNLSKEKESILRKLEENEVSTRAVVEDRLHMCAFRDYAWAFQVSDRSMASRV